MYALGPNARKRQQVLLQQFNNQRTTRQIDSKKARNTFNSRNEKLLNISQDVTMKKKQKLQHTGTPDNTENDSKNEINDDAEEFIPPDVVSSSYVDKENLNDDKDSDSYDDELPIIKNVNLSNEYFVSSQGILGEGHTTILHAYVRDTLFKDIKILSPNHLETNGRIMSEILELLKYSEARNGNHTAFVNACRMEIRKTMCAKRGYVKRQTGLLLSGKITKQV